GIVARRFRFRIFDSAVERMPVPVIVVGNITVGGSGKTPLVIALVEALRGEGYVPGVVSRGYGGTATRSKSAVESVDDSVGLAANDTADTPSHDAAYGSSDDAADRYGDESVLIRSRTGAPVFVGRRRVEVARALLVAHPEVDVLIADDGLQHYALARDFEIAVFDARGAGNRRLLPAGPLREPLERLLDIDAIVLNGDDAVLPDIPGGAVPARTPYRMTLAAGDAWRVNNPGETRALRLFRGRRLTAAAGIGNPQRFFALLRSTGLKFHRMPLDDHHRYRDNPFADRFSEAVLMTEKDAVKCRRFDEERMWAVPVSAQIDPALVADILEHIGGSKKPSPSA
ncbi:MAG: tetraacyldisaccharide 4'-kinase, partial [Burkholderiaceae bacterium]